MTNLPDNEDNRMKRLREAIVGQSDVDLTTLLPQLDAYIDAQINGEDYVGLFPEVAMRLDQSVELSEAYARLYEVAVQETVDYQQQTTEVPQPDLSFLQPSLSERLQDVIERVGNQVRVRLSDALLPLLEPPPSFEPAFRAPDAERYSEHILHLDAEVFTLDAYRDSAETTNCLLEITVEPPGKAWPDLADSIVNVSAGSYAQQEQTDAFGQASFENVPITELASLELAIELSI